MFPYTNNKQFENKIKTNSIHNNIKKKKILIKIETKFQYYFKNDNLETRQVSVLKSWHMTHNKCLLGIYWAQELTLEDIQENVLNHSKYTFSKYYF